MNWPDNQQSVLDEPLSPCSTDPMTGFTRNGCCETGPQDLGSHTVCVQLTTEFLQYSKDQGNDLTTPIPEYNFPGLKEGDRWCLCASRWKEAYDAGVAPKVIMRSTHKNALQLIPFEALSSHALDLS